MNSRRPLLRPLLLLSAALAAPIVPFLLLGESFEDAASGLIHRQWSDAALFWMIAGLLSVDILLPIPSSALGTYGGGALGIGPGTLACWLGLSVGAVLGYLLAKLCGAGIARRLGGEDLDRMQYVVGRYGAAAIVFTRALPILAEACVLLMGLIRLPWRQFLPPLLLSNLAIAATYATFGACFAERDALPVAVLAAAILPLLVAMLLRTWLPATTPRTVETTRPAESEEPC